MNLGCYEKKYKLYHLAILTSFKWILAQSFCGQNQKINLFYFQGNCCAFYCNNSFWPLNTKLNTPFDSDQSDHVTTIMGQVYLKANEISFDIMEEYAIFIFYCNIKMQLYSFLTSALQWMYYHHHGHTHSAIYLIK